MSRWIRTHSHSSLFRESREPLLFLREFVRDPCVWVIPLPSPAKPLAGKSCRTKRPPKNWPRQRSVRLDATPAKPRQTISREILPDKTAAQELAARGLENEPRARGGAKFWLCYIQTRSSLRVKGQNLASQSRAPTLRHRHCSSSSGYWPSCGWMRNSTPSLVACS